MTPLVLLSLCNSSLKCVSYRRRRSCRSTVVVKVGGACVATTGPSSTHWQRVNNWATHSEFTHAYIWDYIHCWLCYLTWNQVLHLIPFCLNSKPRSSRVPVSTLMTSLKTGPFTAVRAGTTNTPIHQATIDRWGRKWCMTALFVTATQTWSHLKNLCCKGNSYCVLLLLTLH